MADWGDLQTELNAWQRMGRPATFWWRDDDARDATQELEHLLTVRRETRVPIAIAVIPVGATDRLAARLGPNAEVTVLQHGFAHVNHAPSDEKKAELHGTRDAEQTIGELIAGRDRLEALLSRKSRRVIVPPWNRMAEELEPVIAQHGFVGVSASGSRRAAVANGLVHVNTHVDIIDWPGTRRFVGEERALDQVVGHLQSRRRGESDADEPTGLLSHHLAHDRGCWAFLSSFIGRTKEHPAVRWLSAHRLFPAPESA